MATNQYSILLDADNCIYNTNYHKLVRYLSVKYHPFFNHFNNVYQFTAEQQTFIDQIITQMLADVHSAYSYHNNSVICHFQDTYKSLGNELVILCPEVEGVSYPIEHYLFTNLMFLSRVGKAGLTLIKEIIYMSNLPFFAKTQTIMQHYDELRIMCGSLRNNFRIEKINVELNGTRYFQLDLELIAEKFQSLLHDKPCQLEPFFLGNFWDENALGKLKQTYVEMIAGIQSDVSHYRVKRNDHSKFVILYAAMHYISILHPHKNKTLGFYDDLTDYLVQLCKQLINYPQFHAPIKVEFATYSGSKAPVYITCRDVMDEESEQLKLAMNLIQKHEGIVVNCQKPANYHYQDIVKALLRTAKRDENRKIHIASTLDFADFISKYMPIPTDTNRLFKLAANATTTPVVMPYSETPAP